jgi:hypothetical protein
MIRKKYEVGDYFVAHPYKMLKSPAYWGLGPCARLVLSRLEYEYVQSGGRENGNIVCTFRDLMKWCGKDSRKIKDAIEELKGLGFIKVKKGRPGTKGYGIANRFGLTYLPKIGVETIEPTHDWAKFDTTEKVVSAKAKAKKSGKRTPLVLAVNNTSHVSAENNTCGPKSTFSCEREMPVKYENLVGVDQHYLDSSNPVPVVPVQPVKVRREGWQ